LFEPVKGDFHFAKQLIENFGFLVRSN
jgi:hypothetical protein